MASRHERTETVQSESIYGRASGRSVYEPVEVEDEPFTPTVSNPHANHPSNLSRRDSSSTFFGRNNDPFASNVDPDPNTRPSGGRTSLYGQPRHEDDAKAAPWEADAGGTFDIYADFNNAGPRYGGAPPLETLATSRDGYVHHSLALLACFMLN